MNKYYTGYFNTFDKVKYGFDNKKRPIYLFNIFNSAQKVKLPYSGKMKGKLIAQIELLDNSKFPLGRIHVLIGEYNKVNVIDVLLTDSEQKYKNIIPKNKSNKLEIYDKKFISIDPLNSVDIDDGFYFDYPYLDIIIASPVFYIDEKIILNKYLESVSSRYYNKTNHLWGDLITEKCSLLEGNEIELLLIKYNLEDETFEIDFKLGKNNKQFSYEEYDVCKDYMSWNKKLKEYFNFDNSKEMISEIMILANKLLTKYFEDNNLQVIYREFIKYNSDVKLPDNIKTIFEYMKSDSAKYTEEICEHGTIKDRYTHFTSPLRRWIDSFHQLILYNYIVKKENIKYDINLEYINYKFSKIKRFHNEYKYLKMNNDFSRLSSDIFTGYIFDINDKLIMKVYVPEINRFVNTTNIHEKLVFQKSITFSDNKWIIKDRIINEKITLNYGQKITLKIKQNDSIFPSNKLIGYFIK